MKNLNGKQDGKQYYKARVGVQIQAYERSNQQLLLQQQSLKQNIMLQILQSREQSRAHPPTNIATIPQPTVHTDVPSTPELPLRLSPNNQEEAAKLHQITFHQQDRNKRRENEQTQFASAESQTAKEDVEEQMDRSICKMAQLTSKYFPQTFNPSKEEDAEMNNYVKLNNPSLMRGEMSENNSSVLNQAEQSQHQQPEMREEQALIDQEFSSEEQDQRGVFLTMGESESMTASELPKNYAFEIKMDKSTDAIHLEELRQLKIKEMEKKRQSNIEEYRKQQSQKKVQQPRPRNTSSSKQERLKEEVEVVVPKSTTIDRKNNQHRPPKIENRSEREQYCRNHPVPLESHQPQPHRVKKTSNLKVNEIKPATEFREQPYFQDLPPKPVSPFRTPKSVASEQRTKSVNRQSNIFAGESQLGRQKSATRGHQPRIQPKERKNSFSRQSNKKLMINAITYVCFPGELNRKERQRLVEVLQTSEHQFFIFLFKEYSRKIIKGIYTLDSSQQQLERIFGEKAPYEISADRVHEFYRFDSGSREFKKVDGCRSFSLAIHAVDLK